MSAELTEAENSIVGSTAAVIETLLLQPTLFYKNALAQGLPLTLNPVTLYRGIGASMMNEVGQLAIGFGVTGALKAWLSGSDGGGTPDSGGVGASDMLAATAGGGVVGLYASPCELLMIQQQRYGGGLAGTALGIAKKHGVFGSGLMRGLIPTVGRDSIYVGGMLGVTPAVQAYLEGSAGMSTPTASVAASIAGGVFGGVLSHPFDVVKTCMQGDVERVTYAGIAQTVRTLVNEGGIARLFNGVGWRTVNITGTVYIANECSARLPPYVMAITRSDRS